MKPKFEVGNVVECIEPTKTLGQKGSGWKLGYQFKIISIDNYSDSSIYWKGFKNDGVYEESLKLVRSKGDEIIYA